MMSMWRKRIIEKVEPSKTRYKFVEEEDGFVEKSPSYESLCLIASKFGLNAAGSDYFSFLGDGVYKSGYNQQWVPVEFDPFILGPDIIWDIKDGADPMNTWVECPLCLEQVLLNDHGLNFHIHESPSIMKVPFPDKLKIQKMIRCCNLVSFQCNKETLLYKTEFKVLAVDCQGNKQFTISCERDITAITVDEYDNIILYKRSTAEFIFIQPDGVVFNRCKSPVPFISWSMSMKVDNKKKIMWVFDHHPSSEIATTLYAFSFV